MNKLMAKSKVLEDLMSKMDEDMLAKLKKGDADVKVTKIVAKPIDEEEDTDIMDFLREEGDETPMGEEKEEDYSELEPIRKRVQSGAMSESEDEEETPEGFEEDEDKDFLAKLKSRFKG